jgi:hypothetical protein
MGRGGSEGRVPSLVTAAVDIKFSDSYFLSFFFDVSSMGIRLKRERNEVYINPKRISPLVTCRQAG